MPDGTTPRIYLLRFNSADMAAKFMDVEIGAGLSPELTLKTAPGKVEIDEEWESATSADGQSALAPCIRRRNRSGLNRPGRHTSPRATPWH
ncbi:hypothetical protein ACFYW6_31020 [Streptomyces sp. NPDC002659]|uniref:hypothetical protein n=1 Tax=Streptomyces sp. NPDC002659 TaxID=3364656 RepID=UPI0036906132